MAEGEFGESPRELPGEGGPLTSFKLGQEPQFLVPFEVPVKEKKLTFEEASKCLNTLGKDESGIRYAYLMITAKDMKLTDVSVILNFKHVLFLDLDGNFLNLDSLNVLAKMPFLIVLKAERNRVESAALEVMPYLQVLDFNWNKITETYDINQPMLETLNLQFNEIYIAQFDSQRLENLKELDLKGNQLMDISGNYPESLEKMFLAQNKITRLNGLSLCNLVNLTTLHLRDNKIRKLNGFSEFLPNLTYLNIRNNLVTKVRQFRKLTCLPKLQTLIFLGNPVQGDIKEPKMDGEDAGEAADDEDENDDDDDDDDEIFGEDQGLPQLDETRIGVLVLLPNLKRINKNVVTLEEKEAARIVKDKKLNEIMEELSSEDETEPPTTTDYTTEIEDETESEEEQVITDPRRHEEDEN